MNDARVKELIKDIQNPNSGKSLVGEKRIENIQIDGEKLSITYRRDDITPVQKRELERQILSALRGEFKEDNITLKTVSQRSEEVYKSIPKQQPGEMTQPKQGAQLQVGHGTIGNKRKIEGVKKVIAVASGKGGVGKSTFAVNLARSLQHIGKKVGLLDADIYGPSLPMLLNKRNEKPMSSDKKKIIPIDAYGMKFISFGLFINEGDPVIWRGPMLGGVLNQFFFDVDWGKLDYLVVDLPPGTGDVQLSLVQNTEVDGAVIISTPQDVALLDAVKALEMFKKLNINIAGLVENMNSFICDQCDKEHFIFGTKGSLEKRAKELGVDYLGGIPLEQELREASDIGIPYMENNDHEGKKAWEAYLQIAKNITERIRV
ncbi:MAG: Mrp/NBP35 family ATP-binding protein [Halobacteriovoraceae bacterium]|nr:Mrp/NBP35 family ATP-binding protein [Halobacteriovoraceae bacterium]